MSANMLTSPRIKMFFLTPKTLTWSSRPSVTAHPRADNQRPRRRPRPLDLYRPGYRRLGLGQSRLVGIVQLDQWVAGAHLIALFSHHHQAGGPIHPPGGAQGAAA